MSFARIAGAVLLFITVALPAAAQPAVPGDPPQLPPRAAPTAQIQVSALPVMDTTPAFDAQNATKAYLAKVSDEARAKSSAYVQGGYLLRLADLVYVLAIAGLLLWLQISTRIRDWAEERTRSRAYQVMLYVAVTVPLMTAASLPLVFYEGYLREHAYGLSNQSLTAWLGDFGTQFLLTLAASLILLPLLYAIIRRARETWWLWGAGLAILFQVMVARQSLTWAGQAWRIDDRAGSGRSPARRSREHQAPSSSPGTAPSALPRRPVPTCNSRWCHPRCEVGPLRNRPSNSARRCIRRSADHRERCAFS